MDASVHVSPNEPHSGGFNFTAAVRRLCEDIVTRLPEFDHVDLSRVAISFCQARKNVPHGLQAALTPLRFENGATVATRGRRRYACERVVSRTGREYLYILSFYLPRFLNHPVEEKLSTIVHELWHISPQFDGDLRRHTGRCYAHGTSQKEYDRQMDALAQRWLALDPPPHLYGFLESTFDELVAEYGAVVGERITPPRLVETRVDRTGPSA